MADTAPEQPGPPAQAPTPTPAPDSTTPEMGAILATLRPIAKYKARSYETSKNTHIPLLQAHLNTTGTTPETTPSSTPTAAPTTPSNPPLHSGPTVVLLGDSMLERMTTTAASPNFPAVWPSPTMLPDETIEQYTSETSGPLRRLAAGTVFNAGVGGDKIQNLAYRLVGDEERGLQGLLPTLARCGKVKLWVVHVGTNNLSAKHGGFKEGDLAALEVIVRALLRVGDVQGVRSKVVVTWLFERKDITDKVVYAQVNHSGSGIKGMCKMLKDRIGLDRVDWLETPPGFKMEEYLEDHVHLNLAGYRWWAEWLFPRIRGYLGNGNVYWEKPEEEEEEQEQVVRDAGGNGGTEGVNQ